MQSAKCKVQNYRKRKAHSAEGIEQRQGKMKNDKRKVKGKRREPQGEKKDCTKPRECDILFPGLRK